MQTYAQVDVCSACEEEFFYQQATDTEDVCPECGAANHMLSLFSQVALDNWRAGDRYRTEDSHELDDAVTNEESPITG